MLQDRRRTLKHLEAKGNIGIWSSLYDRAVRDLGGMPAYEVLEKLFRFTNYDPGEMDGWYVMIQRLVQADCLTRSEVDSVLSQLAIEAPNQTVKDTLTVFSQLLK